MAKLISKILEALVALPRVRRARCNKLVMTLLVKDEADMLEQNILFHHAMGVDAFIITDNNSTDETPAIIEKYRQKGWVAYVIQEKGTDYRQKQWVDRMIQYARHQLSADWIINADADEFWYAPSGSLKHELSLAKANVVHCNIRSMYPEEDKHWTQWEQRVEFVENQADYELSPYSMFQRQRGKVAHKADGYLQIGMGNHKVAMLPRTVTNSNILIYHYNIRSCETFVAKMKNGGEQLLKHPSKHGGSHWRYFYNLYLKGELEEEYGRVIGTHCRGRLEADRRLVHDATMQHSLRLL